MYYSQALAAIEMKAKIITRDYGSSPGHAVKFFQSEVEGMGERGYSVKSEEWVPGKI